MTNDINIIARRIAREMIKSSKIGPTGIPYFMGLGVSLAIVWEVSHGHKPGTANTMKPQEILEWAKNLPESKIIIVN